jgi:thiol-disulfide isomerase/thioredoxin
MWSIRLAIGLSLLWFGDSAHAAFKAGDTLPDLSSFQLEGQVPSPKGKVVLLDFWASWCAPCKASFPAMNDLQKRYGEKGLVVIAVNVDEKAADMEKFLKQTNPGFSVVRDVHHKLVKAADVATMPASFLVDRGGKIRFLHQGFNGDKTRKEYDREIETLLSEVAPVP